MAALVEKSPEPKLLGVKAKGTPEGEKMVRVRCKVRVRYGATPGLEKMYEVGEVLTIKAYQYTSYNNPPSIEGKDGKQHVIRGSFEPEDWAIQIDDNVARHTELTQTLLNENDALRKQLADIQAAQTRPMDPKAPKGKREEI